jgi:hypothetical protein
VRSHAVEDCQLALEHPADDAHALAAAQRVAPPAWQPDQAVGTGARS